MAKNMKQGVNSSEMQKTNRTLVFKALLENKGITRTELANEMGLQKATITNIINSFNEIGIVTSDGDSVTGRRGEKLFLKLDGIFIMSIGITRKDYEIGMLSMFGERVEYIHYIFEKKESMDSIIEKMKRDSLGFLEKYGRNKVIGICLAVPGLFVKDPENGSEMYIVTEFDELNKINIHKEMEEALGRTVFIKHDAKLSAYAEWKHSKETRENPKASLIIIRSRGYGVGAGIVINGKIIEGQLGIAGEIGYTGIDYKSRYFRDMDCGALEYCAGTESVVRYVNERLFEFPESPLTSESSYKEILEAYKKGDKLAQWAIDKLAWVLGYGVANVVYTINPDCVILGADYPDTEDFLEKVRESACKRIPAPLRKYVNIRFSELSEDSFMLGGFYYVLEQLYKKDIIGTIRIALQSE
ncbi:MAG: ROK family protein [Candidatus Choladocola sp.]|nr:ROK family protein [Candidatus Choladocola sp.]